MKCWILDTENDPVYANLALSFPKDGFLILDWQDIKCSLTQGPPGTPPEVWDGYFKRVFCESCFIREGGNAMVSVLLGRCRQEQQGRPVALRHLYRKLIELRYRLMERGREYSYFEAVKNRLEGLLENPMFDCLVGFDWAGLASRNVLFRLNGLGNYDYYLFVNYLLSFLESHMQPRLGIAPELFVVLEETHRLASPQRLRRTDNAEPILLDAARTLGKRGVSLVFVDQVPSQLPVDILANTGFRAIFNTIEGRDLDAIQRSLGLSYEQRVFVSHLPRAACIVQYDNPKFPEPFPVVMDEISLRDDVDSEVAERRALSCSQLSYVPVREPDQARAAQPSKPPLVSTPAQDYLAEIAKDQFLPASKRDQLLGVPLSQGNALRAELSAAGLVSLERVNTYGRARRITNCRVTEKGYELLRDLKVPFQRPRGKGSWQHVYHQHAVAAWGRLNGYQARVEHMHDGKAADVCLEKDGRRVAAEVLCKGVQKELANLRDLHTGYSEVWFCVPDEREAWRLRELVSATFGEESGAILARTRFKLLADFQNSVAPEGKGSP